MTIHNKNCKALLIFKEEQVVKLIFHIVAKLAGRPRPTMRNIVGEIVVLLGSALCVAALGRDHVKVRIVYCILLLGLWKLLFEMLITFI